MEALTGVRWGYIAGWGVVYGVVFRLALRRSKVPIRPRDLIGTALLVVALAVLPAMFHASRDTTELCAVFALAFVIEELLGLLWRRRVASPSGAKGPE